MNGKTRTAAGVILFFFALLLLISPAAEGEGPAVALIPVQGTIDPGTGKFLERALAEAVNAGVAAIILELDTPGGGLEAAIRIRELMDDCPQPVFAFVRPAAGAAGAYLALAADAIYMAPGSTMGAGLDGRGSGGIDEKTLSTWEEEMSAQARLRGRDPRIAAAMVRPEAAIPEVVEAGQLLTLAPGEALSLGYCEGVAENRLELLEQIGFPGAGLLEFSPTWDETLIRWITRPAVAVILLVMGIGGLILEVLTPGFGLAGLISLLAFAFYFGGQIMAGHGQYWVVFLFPLGILLMVVEAFIPGFGVFGIGGLTAVVASLVLAAPSVLAGLKMLALALVSAGVLVALSFRFLARRGALRHLILSDEERSELGYVVSVDRRTLLDREGTALMPLRPSGLADIDGQRVDVVSEGGVIPRGARVKVVAVEGVRVVVRRAVTGVPER